MGVRRMMNENQGIRLVFPIVAAAAALMASAGRAQGLEGQALAEALAGGGYVLVMRHASSPRERPSEDEAARGNVNLERQLDEMGRAEMAAMAYAFRVFGLPVGDLLTSPAFRAVESGRYFGFGEEQVVAELGGGGDANWLSAKAGERPAEGNTVMITHGRNLVEAFGLSDVEAGESLIFNPTEDGAELVARMTIKDWAELAVALD